MRESQSANRNRTFLATTESLAGDLFVSTGVRISRPGGGVSICVPKYLLDDIFVLTLESWIATDIGGWKY